MSRQALTALSVLLIFLGVVTLLFNLTGPLLEFRIWRLWPIFVIAVGLGLVLSPLFVNRPGLKALFIPGVPVLTTGVLLLFVSLFQWWSLWGRLWPLEVIALAAGLLLASLGMRVIWLMIPAVILGLNGFLLQFCVLTGFWQIWALLWVIEPLSVGIALWLVNIKMHRHGLRTAAIILLIVTVLGFVESLTGILLGIALPMGKLWKWAGPAALVVGGIGVLVWMETHRASPTPLVTE